jgi:NADH-quinone oxidoreductase subunit H
VKLLAFMSKVVVIVFLGMVVRWSIPRLRYDQVMMVAWQGLIPLSLGLVLVNSVLVYFNMATLVPLLLGNIALAAVTLAFAPLLKQSTVNRRIPLYGSRFSPMPGEVVQSSPLHPMARADN